MGNFLSEDLLAFQERLRPMEPDYLFHGF